jgi:hypothetical protein
VDPSTWMVEMNECGEAIVSIMVVCRTILKSPNPQYNLSYKSSSSPQASIVSLYIAYLPTLSSSCRPLYPSSLPLSLSLSRSLPTSTRILIPTLFSVIIPSCLETSHSPEYNSRFSFPYFFFFFFFLRSLFVSCLL